jgi:isocitrate lyase
MSENAGNAENSKNTDIAGRLTAVEDEVARLRAEVRRDLAIARTDAAAARVLAAGAHEDVADVRAALAAHTRTLNALRETQLEQGQAIAGLRTRVSSLEVKMDAGFAMMEDKFAMVNMGIAAIADMLRNNPDEPGEPDEPS